jgi:cell division protein FtsB
MNDEEAFEYWLESMRVRGDRPEGYERRAWQAACEWKQHEVDAYREAARTEAEFVNELQAENSKIRDEFKFQTPPAVIAYQEMNDKLQAENSFLKENINGTRMKQMNEEIERLKAENAKLKECLKETNAIISEFHSSEFGSLDRAFEKINKLKELDEE